MAIVPHPVTFLQHLSAPERRQALAELEAIRQSGCGSLYRGTRYPAVHAAPENYFRWEIARRVGVTRP